MVLNLTVILQAHIIPVLLEHVSSGLRVASAGGGQGMDKKKMEISRRRLEDRQRELRETVNRTAQDGREADLESAQDIADRAAQSYTKEFLFTQSNNERQLLQMVEGALSRIHEGASGSAFPAVGDQSQTSGGSALDPPLHRVPGETRKRIAGAHWRVTGIQLRQTKPPLKTGGFFAFVIRFSIYCFFGFLPPNNPPKALLMVLFRFCCWFGC